MKRIIAVLLILCFSLVPIVAFADETDYSYLDDMTINQLKELDKEIHKRLPTQEEETENTEEDDIFASSSGEASEAEKTESTEESSIIGEIGLTYSNSESEFMTIEEYAHLLSNNNIKFKEMNKGATLTLTGYAQKVEGPVTINGMLFSNGYVYLTADKSPFEDIGFSFGGIYVAPLSKDEMADIDLNTIVALSGKYSGYISGTPVVSATTKLVILDE